MTNIQEIVKQVKAALDHRESFQCDSEEYEKANEAVNKILFSLKSEDLPEFNRLFELE